MNEPDTTGLSDDEKALLADDTRAFRTLWNNVIADFQVASSLQQYSVGGGQFDYTKRAENARISADEGVRRLLAYEKRHADRLLKLAASGRTIVPRPYTEERLHQIIAAFERGGQTLALSAPAVASLRQGFQEGRIDFELCRTSLASTTVEGDPPSPTGFLGGAALADALGVQATRRDAFFRQLGRKRISLGDDSWQEVRDRHGNGPIFLYRVDSPNIIELAKHYSTEKLA